MDQSVEKFVSQGTVDNNRAISQQLMELNGWVWSRTGTVKGTAKDCPPKMTVQMPKAAPSEEQYQSFTP